MTVDIVKMCRQILVHPDDTDNQWILPVKEYNLQLRMVQHE